jgi:hypothetical protein
MLKLSDTQRSMLQAAAARDDRFLQPLANARRSNLKAFAAKLVEAGWAKEIATTNSTLVLRKSTESGEAFALKLTAKGVKAVAALRENEEGAEKPPVAPATKRSAIKAAASHAPSHSQTNAAGATANTSTESSAATTRAPRASSKLGRVLEMLAADAGATIRELTASTGWLEHTTRAALTGLRHRGYTLSLSSKERDGASVYRIVTGGGDK